MKRTAKFTAGLKVASKAGGKGFTDNESLYAWLAGNNYAWDSSTGEWTKTNRPVSASGVEKRSMFSDEQNAASGLVRLRLMSHPGDMERFLEIVVEALDTYAVRIEDISDQYPNRKGEGVRVYCTCILPPPKRHRD